MIGRLRGIVVEQTPGSIVLEVGRRWLPGRTRTAASQWSAGVRRGDTRHLHPGSRGRHSTFGFHDKLDREAFETLGFSGCRSQGSDCASWDIEPLRFGPGY